MRKAVIFILIIFLSLTPLVTAQSLGDDPRVGEAIHFLELWLDAQRAYEQIPGISFAFVHDQELVWSRGFGYSDLDKKTPTTPKTIYSICSISKLFTSVAVLQLRDQGFFRLDDPVGNILPWFDIKQTYPDGPAVTVKGLLTHSSGLPRESDHPYWTGPDFMFPTREQIIERLSHQKTLYPADKYFQYSNLGLSLAGEVIAEVSGKSYADYVTESILVPLDLKDTRPELPEHEKGRRLATGYSAITREGVRKPCPFFQARGIAPAAGYSSTVEDLAKFASWQFRLLENGGSELLNVNTLREMHRVQWMDPDWETAWGLGFAVWRNMNETFVGHGGSCPGYRTQLLLNPKNKIATIFMANASGVNTRMFTQQAFQIVASAIKAALDSTKAAEPPDPKLKKFTGTYSVEPWGGEMAVFFWKGNLAMVSFPNENPVDRITKLKHVEENVFKRIRDDGELGEEVVFETDSDGKVIRLQRHNNYYRKLN